MERILQDLFTASLHGSIVILAVLLLRLLLRKTPKKYICLLWLLAGVRLLLPIEIRSEWSLQPRFALPEIPAGAWTAAIPWIWGAIACCFGAYSLVSYLKLKNQVRDAVRIRGGWESDKIDTAFILGFIKPRIYIPAGMTNQSKRHILAHERTHLDKGDHWIKMIGFLALSLHWFNPLVWLAYILLCKDIEMACDERVVQFMELDERKAYSSALLSCSSHQTHFAASPVAFGEVSVKKRILSVLNYKKPGFWISLLGVLAFFFVTICLMPSPPAQPVTETLMPEQQAAREKAEKCLADVENLFANGEFYYVITGCDTRGSARWNARIAKFGSDTIWMYDANNNDEITDGCMELGGKHYAWYDKGWMETEDLDEEFTDWEELFQWDSDTVKLAEQAQEDGYTTVSLDTHWEGADGTVYLSPVVLYYDQAGNLAGIAVNQPNYADTTTVYLDQPWDKKSASDILAEAQMMIQPGRISGEELKSWREYNTWGVAFHVAGDGLSSRGATVAFSQSSFGKGNLSTTDEYWLEKYENGSWEKLPTVAVPIWEGKTFGLSKGNTTSEYLDWTPIYGALRPGEYRMGKVIEYHNQEENVHKNGKFYAEFQIYEAVEDDSPEAKAAVERCYSKLEELAQRTEIHWRSAMATDSEFESWTAGEDYLHITHYFSDIPEEEMDENMRSLVPRTDTAVRYQGVGYRDVRENPEVLTSAVLGLGVTSLHPYGGGWDTWAAIGDDFNFSFFTRGNFAVTFPDGVGAVSDEMVRFQGTWDGTEDGPIITYRFDSSGNLSDMEYRIGNGDGTESVFTIEIFDDMPQEIRKKIATAAENPSCEDFSWEEAREKYINGDFNIRQDSFVNTAVSSITGPIEAATLALKEYPTLEDGYQSLRVFQDAVSGMWKVTIESYVNYQSTYEYRDVYLSDSGITQLLVYEGPIGFDEARK